MYSNTFTQGNSTYFFCKIEKNINRILVNFFKVIKLLLGVYMDNKINVTKKLVKIVKHRKTPLVITKQDNNYNRIKKISGNLSYESYSFTTEE